MDIDLFADMVRNLILDNDEVTLPGLGTFVSELVPSSFSDKGYTINPPYRRLSFRQRSNDGDTMLADFYSRANGTDIAASARILSDFISGLKETLVTKKVVVFPGLGRLRATKENAFFFIPDEDLDIYPYGVGLEPVSLKTHEEIPVAEEVLVADEVPAAVEIPATVPEPAPVPEPAVEPSLEPVAWPAAELAAEPAAVPSTEPAAEPSVEPVVEPVASPAPDQGADRKALRKILVASACLIGAAAVLLGIFLLLSRTAPDFIDSILYTPEELRIINY